jgi:Tol biopolymer transport system component
MRAARLLFVLGLLALATGCDRKTPTGPSDTTTPVAPAGAQRSTGPIAFVSDRDGTDQIYLADEDGSAVTRLTAGVTPAWSRDGQRLAFHLARETYVINVDGSGLRRVTHGWEPKWSPDGRTLVFRDTGIEVIDIDGSSRRRLYDDEGYGAFHPAWSPDGRRIAFTVGTYISDSPPLGMWVINADGSDARPIGLYDGELPVWSPDSSEIAFVTRSTGIDVSNADGSGRRTRVAGPVVGVDWTPDGRLIFTKSPTPDWYVPGQRIFISDGGAERQLIPDAAAPARSNYSDRHPVWRR